MRIRQMEGADYENVYQLWAKTPGIGLRKVDDSKEGILGFLQRNPNTNFVAEEDGIVGVILCGHDGRRAHIYHMAVDANMKRSGIGRALVEAVIAALMEQGITRVKLDSFKDNPEGNAFWESMGFFCRSDLLYWNRSLDDRNV